MKKLWIILLSMPAMGMFPDEVDVELGDHHDQEYFCRLAIESYNKRTGGTCSPNINPYLVRLIDFSCHNGDSAKFDQMKKEIKEEDELYLSGLVDKAVNTALKDKEQQITERITRRDAAFYIAAAGLGCSIASTGITLAATLNHCTK